MAILGGVRFLMHEEPLYPTNAGQLNLPGRYALGMRNLGIKNNFVGLRVNLGRKVEG